MSSMLVRSFFYSATRIPHWIWVTAFFLAQFVGAVGVIWWLQMEMTRMILPLCLLLTGAFLTACFHAGDPADPSSMSWKRWIPFLFYAAFIFSLSSRSFGDVSLSFNAGWFHPIEYFSLGLILCFVWYPLLVQGRFGPFALRVLLSGVLLGIADEVLQSFVPGRYPSLLDVVLDLLGLSAALGVFWVARYVRNVCAQGDRSMGRA